MSTYAKIEHSLYDNPKIVGLSCEAFRAYVEGILYSGKNLTDGFLDERIVSRMWGNAVAEELTTNDPVNPSWQRVEGGWLIYGFTERQNTKEHVETVKKKRKEAAQKRWDDAKSEQTVSKTDAKSMQNAYKTDAKGMPYTDTYTNTNNKEHTFNKVEHDSEYSKDFETWWQAYPRKQAKGDAWKAWKSLKKALPNVDVLVAASIEYGKNVTDPQFLKMPGPWLRARRWEDVELQPKQVDYLASRGIPNWDTKAPEGKKYWYEEELEEA
jgi:hypothetical protein